MIRSNPFYVALFFTARYMYANRNMKLMDMLMHTQEIKPTNPSKITDAINWLTRNMEKLRELRMHPNEP